MPKIAGVSPGSSVNVVCAGPVGAPPVVLVHAVGLDLTYWDRQFAALGERFRLIAYDLPGHGASTPSGLDFAAMAETLQAVIRASASGPCHVVGVSVGGMIAQALALSNPSLIRSLTLIDSISTFADAGREALRERAALTRREGMQAILQPTLDRWFTEGFAARRPDVIDRTTKTLLADDPEIHAGMWEMIATLDTAPRLGEIDIPTLVLVGQRDLAAPVAASKMIADRLPGARLEVMADAAHITPLEIPDIINGHLDAFVAAN